MTPYKLILLFFGLPLSVLTLGLRRGLGTRALALLFLGANGVALYALAVEAMLRQFGWGLPLPSMETDGFHASRDFLRLFGPTVLAGAWLGTLGGVLVRLRRRGPS